MALCLVGVSALSNGKLLAASESAHHLQRGINRLACSHNHYLSTFTLALPCRHLVFKLSVSDFCLCASLFLSVFLSSFNSLPSLSRSVSLRRCINVFFPRLSYLLSFTYFSSSTSITFHLFSALRFQTAQREEILFL